MTVCPISVPEPKYELSIKSSGAGGTSVFIFNPINSSLNDAVHFMIKEWCEENLGKYDYGMSPFLNFNTTVYGYTKEATMALKLRWMN